MKLRAISLMMVFAFALFGTLTLAFCAEELSILGIKIGDDKEKAVELIKSNFAGMTFENFRSCTKYESYESDTFYMGLMAKNGNMRFPNHKRINQIALLFDQKEKLQVIGVKREVRFADTKPTQESVLRAIKDRFGEPKHFHISSNRLNVKGEDRITGSLYFWSFDSKYVPKNPRDFWKLRDYYSFHKLLHPSWYINRKFKTIGRFLLVEFSHSISNDRFITSAEFLLEDTNRIAESIDYVSELIIKGEAKKRVEDEKKGNKVKMKF